MILPGRCMRTNLEERLNSFISCFAKISLLCSFNASNCVFRFYHIQDQSLGLFHCWLEYGKSLLKILADQRNYVWQLVEILSTSFWHFLTCWWRECLLKGSLKCDDMLARHLGQILITVCFHQLISWLGKSTQQSGRMGRWQYYLFK